MTTSPDLPYPYSVRGVADSFTGYRNVEAIKLFYGLFGEICSVYKYLNYTLDEKTLKILHEKYSKEKCYNRFQSESEEASCSTIERGLYCVILKQHLLMAVSNDEVMILYVKDKNDNDAEALKDFIRPYLIKNDKDDESERLFMVIKGEFCFELQSISLKQTEIDIPAFYNDDFMPIHEIIRDGIQRENCGLIILHGLHGTGKTTYIRHLIKTTTQRFIYVPGEMAEVLAQPSFLPFLCRYPGSILILEDCEELLKQRQVNRQLNPAIVNILNMTDGILGDGFQMKFICTFNAPIQDVDKALLRKGRLIAKYNFGKLAVDKVNRLAALRKLSMPKVENPMSLAEIFNYEHKSFEPSVLQKIGFKGSL